MSVRDWANSYREAKSESAPVFVLDRNAKNELVLYRQAAPREVFQIDLLSTYNQQLIKTFGKHQTLPKALGVPKGMTEVWDLTAGLGEDTWALASLGLKVYAFERHPLVAWMLSEALETAKQSEFSNVAERIELSARAFHPDVDRPMAGASALFDPMFVDKERKTKPRKEMIFLSEVVGPDEDQLASAISAQSCFARLAIKRSAKQPNLLPHPNLTFPGKGFRYDVYLQKNKCD